MKKIILSLLVLTLFSGCQSDAQKLDSICNKLLETSKMTDDCDKMAKALDPVYADYINMLDKLSKSVPDEAARIQITEANSLCTKSVLEIATGVCGTHPNIKAMTNRE